MTYTIQGTTVSTEYRVVDPATGQQVEVYTTATDVDVETALATAHHRYSRWGQAPIAGRAALLRRVGALVRERAEPLARLITTEMGKPHAAALGELSLVADIFDYYADSGPQMLEEHSYEPASGGTAIMQKRPIGVVLGIMPWNYPYYQMARLVAPNLLLGNTILLKPAPSCPSSALAIAVLLHDAGIPDGCYINLFATHDQVARIVADERVRGVSLTGSERAGAAVAEIAGRHLKKVVLELGGSDPLLVLDATDPEAMARTAYGARMANLGQACNSPKRMIVMADIHDAFVEAIVGLARSAGAAPDRLPPMSSRGVAERVASQVSSAVADGATLQVGGELSQTGAFVTPAVLTGVTREMAIGNQEVFGPVVVVHRVNTIDEAVALANDSDFGLGASVFSDNDATARFVAERLDCGMVFVNTAPNSEPDLPFGGTKRSGFGRELGQLGITEFANLKLIRLA